MNYLSVYRIVENNSVFIKLMFNLNARPYTLSRLSTDSVGKTLKRVGLSVSKATTAREGKKPKKGRHQNSIEDIPVTLFNKNGEVIDSEVSNLDAWVEGNVLEITDCKFLVEEDTPIVLSASIPSVLMAGFPVVPTLKLEFSDKINSQYKWFKEVSNTGNETTQSSDLTPEHSDFETDKEWIEIGQGFVYVPSVHDIGCVLKLSCKAANSEKEAHSWFNVVTSSCVSAGPGFTPFEARQLYTNKPTDDPSTFRVVSYNILADCYLEDEVTCDMWFGYCPKYALAIDYRQQLLLKEILGYNGDIICLQECGCRLFKNYLNPVMKSKGYTGLAMYKGGVMPEGEAIFFRDSKFSLVSEQHIVIKDSFLSDPCNKDLLQKVEVVPKVLEKLASRTTIAQIVVLHCIDHPQDYICLVNTHLYFRPNASFIRNLQVMTILNLLKQTMVKLDLELKQKSTEKYNIGIVFCGDFNSLPESGLVQLMCSGTLEADHPEWVLPEETGQPVANLKMSSYSHSFGFQNCCGFPTFTTYTEAFKGVIDYVFASMKSFDVQAVIPMPLAEELQVYTAVPSPVMPSDHVALICELKWRST